MTRFRPAARLGPPGRRLLVVPLALLLAGLAAGCGGEEDPAPAVAAVGTSSTGSTTTSAGAPSAKDVEQARLDFARCMREEGVEVADPAPSGGGPTRIAPAKGADPKAMQAAQQKCGRILEEAGVGGELSEEDRQRFEDAALAFARCMREHGVDMPDPSFDGRGAVQMRMGDPDDPTFEAASEACRSKLPRLPEEPS